MARRYANQFDAVMAGYKAGREAVKDWRSDQTDTEAGNQYKLAAMQTEGMSGPATQANFEQNYVPGATGTEQSAAEYIQNHPEITQAFASERKADFTLDGKTRDTRYTPQEQNIAGMRAMGAVYSGAGEHDKALKYNSASDAAETHAQQRELTGMQIDTAQRDQRWRKATEETVANFNKGLVNPDGTQRAPTLKESYDLAEQMADVNMRTGHGHIFDRAEAKTKAAAAQKEGYIEALKMAHAGNKEEAIKAFNRYGDMKIADLNLTPTVMNVSGVKVPTYAINGTTEDGKPFNLPNAYGAMVQGMTFEQAAKAEEVAAHKTSAGAAATSAGAAVTSAAATAALHGVQTRSVQLEQAGAMGASKLAKDPAAALTPDEQAGVQYITGKNQLAKNTPEAQNKALIELDAFADKTLTIGKGAMDSMSPELTKRAEAIKVRMAELGREAVDKSRRIDPAAIYKQATDDVDRAAAIKGKSGAKPVSNAPANYSTLWGK